MTKQPQQVFTKFPFTRTLITLIAFIIGVYGDFNRTKELYSNLFSHRNNQIHPSLNTSVPTEVYVQLHFISLREIVEREQYFVINACVQFTWKDEIRSWDPSQYDGVHMVYPELTDMWRPRVIVTNSIGKRDLFEEDTAPFSLSWDGSARWLPGTVFSLSCTMDMTYFPFDQQTCELTFLSQEYITDINLFPATPTVDTLRYIRNGEWHLESTSVTSRPVSEKKFEFSRLIYTFNFRRRPGFYLFNVLMPVVLMSLLSPLVFLLPEDSGERVSYAVTLLLSLAVFMGFVASLLPQTSEPLSLCIVYMFVMLIHSGLCVVCSVVLIRWEKYKRDRKHTLCEKQGLHKELHKDVRQNDNHSQHSQVISQGNSDSNSSVDVNKFSGVNESNLSKQENVFRQIDHDRHGNTTMRRHSQGNKKINNILPREEKSPRLFECRFSANIVLLLCFYFSWFATSVYFYLY
ncbi:neuronal acetylcholine receptor subunit alpha-6 [Plakobranchus ocellatus]|uniref:Neuronal acetylcholine receptor subunit alpha-6 n=1 Tax=Plakobranchus ocellatus TaxID=259542 RepID=A0AAV3YIE6_9GAST|nr:neuronal acetylcholine receptor subunit alpha-6 [Plakobranchus ocellatus]